MNRLLFLTFQAIFGLILLFPDQGRAEQPLTAQASLSPYEVDSEQVAQLSVKMQLPPGYKAYLDQFRLTVVEPEGFKISQFAMAPQHAIVDKFTKKKKMVMAKEATITAPIEIPILNQGGEQKFILKLTYQACTDTYCLFPEDLLIDVPFKLKSGKLSAEPKGLFSMSFAEVYKEGLAWAFLFVFIFGFLTSFTPCVYPMIPITLSILGKEAHARSKLQNFFVSVCYVLGIAITFSALGVLAASTGVLFGSFMASPWILGFVGFVFFAMSLSLFGLFEIEAPQFLRDGLLSHLQLHGYLGALISGMLAGVVASPCVGPVLVGVLTFVAQSKDLWLGFWLLFTYALGMGLIFLALGMSTNLVKKLPRSGPWMNRVKIFFGILMLGASLYYVNLLFMTSKVYTTAVTTETAVKSNIVWVDYSEDVLKKAAVENKPALIDFRADWCAACIEMEEKTYPMPEVEEVAKNFVMIRFDATQDSEVLSALRKKYEIVGLPTNLFFSPKGEWLKDLTLTEFEKAQPFAERMKKALKP